MLLGTRTSGRLTKEIRDTGNTEVGKSHHGANKCYATETELQLPSEKQKKYFPNLSRLFSHHLLAQVPPSPYQIPRARADHPFPDPRLIFKQSVPSARDTTPIAQCLLHSGRPINMCWKNVCLHGPSNMPLPKCSPRLIIWFTSLPPQDQTQWPAQCLAPSQASGNEWSWRGQADTRLRAEILEDYEKSKAMRRSKQLKDC